MYSPGYYGSDADLKAKINAMAKQCHQVDFKHPLAQADGSLPSFKVYRWGSFGAVKGPQGKNQTHHPAMDFHVGNRSTNVTLHAAYEGRITTFRNAPKYRHYLALTRNITDKEGKLLGKLVTIYAHIDLDKDEADGIKLNGKDVRQGDVVSKHLYSGTRGGPHLHFEIRYYRPTDQGDETFYGMKLPFMRNSNLTAKSNGPWKLGYWNPEVGYGYADPRNFGIKCD